MKNLITGLLVAWFSGRVSKLLMLTLIVIFAVPDFVSAVTFIVQPSNSDQHDRSPGDGNCADFRGVCTLRAAIEESNALRGEEIVINLPAGTYGLTEGELRITVSLALQGEGPNSTIIDGNGQSGVFLISQTNVANPSVNISGVKVTNGSFGAFGGIFINPGTSLSLSNCIVSENSGSQGGGILNEGSLVITNCIVSNNSSDGEGVGIDNFDFLQIFDSTIRDNIGTPDPRGGGFFTRGGGIANLGTAEIHRSTISGNLQNRGGGIYNEGNLEITNSTISGNKANVGGGGILNFGNGIVNIAFSTITNNEAGLDGSDEPVNRVGGGILNCYTLFGSLTCATVNIGNTILAGNRDLRFPSEPAPRPPSDALFSPDCFSLETFKFTSFRGNLVGVVNTNCNLRDTIFGTDISFDMVGTANSPLDPQLELDVTGKPRLANNGGPTQTHALLRGSPAIDQGTGVTSATFFDCPETDQRGFTRPVDGNSDGRADCDIGAFEFGAIPPEIVNNLVSQASNPVTSLSTVPTPDGPAGTLFITATFTNTSNIPIRKPFFQVIELSGGNVLINSDVGPAGVGATLTPNVGPDQLLTPAESVTTEFRIGLQTLNSFSFLVDVMGEPVD